MRWESSERRRATFVLAILLFVAMGLLILQQTPSLGTFRTWLWRIAEPTPRALARLPISAVSPNGPALPEGLGRMDRRLLQDRLTAVLAENARLRQLVGFQTHRWPTAQLAQVIGRDPQYWFRSLLIAQGAAEGVTTDAPVIAVEGTQEGLAGRVSEVAPHVAKVLLITDPMSAVIGICRRLGEEGMVVGTTRGELEWRYLTPETQIHAGDLVETSGSSDLFPPGIPLGWVTDVSPQETMAGFRSVRLRPAIAPAHPHEVLVLTPPSQ